MVEIDIVLKFKPHLDNLEYYSGYEEGDTMFPYIKLRDKECINDLLNGDEIIYKGDYVIINVEERYRYVPIPIKVFLNDAIVKNSDKSNIPKAVNYNKFTHMETFKNDRKELEECCGRDVFSELHPLITSLDNKIRKIHFESFKKNNGCIYVDKRVMANYKKNNGLTILNLLNILRHLINTVYPANTIDDQGVTCHIGLTNDTISYNMN